MSKKTFYVVQPFEVGRRGAIRVGTPIEARSAIDAERIARRMSLSKVAVIAFSNEVDLDSGDSDLPIIIVSFGQVPEGVLESV
ncbi:hypothetical protein GCM10028812_53760 [Ancylobacter sonchi]